jgi:hypothetical protein
LNNPEVLRQSMELARNPAAFQELMRTQDRALSNLESIPGGYNALQRMYRDIQEPMLNAVQERLTGNPFAELLQNNGAPNPQQGVENRDPLPNPWAAPTTGGGSAAPTSNPSSTPGSGGTAAGQTGANPAGGAAGMMQQMMQNMGGMQNLLNTPYTQNLLDSLLSNPDLAQQMMGANPLFANNPQMQEQLRAMTPTLLNQLRDPEFQQVLSNPAALQAIMQIQQGIEQLRVAAPGFANRYNKYLTFVLLCLRVGLELTLWLILVEWDLEICQECSVQLRLLQRALELERRRHLQLLHRAILQALPILRLERIPPPPPTQLAQRNPHPAILAAALLPLIPLQGSQASRV